MKHAARWIAIIALFTIPFLPLYVANGLFFPFITGKGFAFRILIEIALSAYVLLAVLDARYRPRFSWTLVLFGGLVAWMIVANALGVNPHKAFWSNYERMDGWVMLVHVFALFLIAGPLLTVEKLWRRWWLFFVSVAALVCGYGLLQLMGGAEIHQAASRLDASFGNAIYMAVYLMFAILVSAWLAATSHGWVRYALIAFIPLATIVLFFTGSRGPLIGLVTGAVAASALWLLCARNEWRGGVSVGLKVAAGALIGLVVVIGGFFLARDSAFVKQDPILSRVASVFSLNQELRVRSTIWGMALEGVKEDPLTGYGQEGFNQVFNTYYKPSLYGQESWFDRAHNMYIDWLVAGGIPALLLFLGILITGVLVMLRAPDMPRAQRVILTGALVAYAVQALVVFDNLFSYVPLVMLLAMAHMAVSRPTRLQELPEVRGETNTLVAGIVAAIVAIALIWTVNVPGMRAGYHLIQALSPSTSGAVGNLTLFKETLADGSFASQELREQLVSFAARVAQEPKVSEALRTEFVAYAVDEMGKEVAANPNDARLRVEYASAFEAMGAGEEALEQIDTAVALSPQKQSLLLSQGFKRVELGLVAEAKESFLKAYELDPSVDEVAVSVASGYLLAGDDTHARTLLLESVGTTTPDNDALFYAYYKTKQWSNMIAVARTRVETVDSAAARLRLAQAYSVAGRFEEARAEIIGTMTAFPESRAEAEALMSQMFPGQ